MTMKERYATLKKAAQEDVRAVRNRRTVFSGAYPKGCATLDGITMLENIKTARTLGYETHLRVVNDVIEVYHVANMPSAPSSVLYA